MSADKILTNNKSFETKESNYFKREEDNPAPWENMAVRYGLVAGIMMSLYLLFINWGEDVGMTFRFMKYIILGVVIAVVLGRYKTKAPKFSYFKHGILLGATTSFISGLIVALSNLGMHFYAPEATFQKFGMVGDTLGDALTLSVVLLFEIFVLGMILTFICLQYYKRDVRMK